MKIELEKLIMKIRAIDEEAADYLEDRYYDIPNTHSLGGVFVWSNTPQGHYYWDSISKKLEEYFE